MQRLLNKTPEGLITDHINRTNLITENVILRNADKRINVLIEINHAIINLDIKEYILTLGLKVGELKLGLWK